MVVVIVQHKNLLDQRAHINFWLSLTHDCTTMLCVVISFNEAGGKVRSEKVILCSLKYSLVIVHPWFAILIYSRHSRATQNIKIRFASLNIFNNIGI